MKKILILGPRVTECGGVSTHLNQLLHSTLNKDFCFSHLIVTSSLNETFYQKYTRIISNPFRFINQLIVFDPDLIHVNPSFDIKSFIRDSFFILIGKAFKKKIIVQFHGGTPDIFEKNIWVGIYFRTILKISDHILVLSEAVRKSLMRKVTTKKLIKFPNMVDLTTYTNIKNCTKSEKNIKVIFLSRIIETKGIYEIMEAIPLIVAKYPYVKFKFAGNGEDVQYLIHFADKMKISDYIELAGFIKGEEKIQTLNDSDIFILPSHNEGFPYALVEAMAAGLPIITCPVGAIPEYIYDGLNGFLIPIKRPDLLADRILKLMNDSKLRNRMGRINKNIVLKKLDINIMVNRLAKIYQAVIALILFC